MVYSCACTPSAACATYAGSRRASRSCPRLSAAKLRRQGNRGAGDDRSRAPGVRYAMPVTPNARTRFGCYSGHSRRRGRALPASCRAAERRSAARSPTRAQSPPTQPAAEEPSAAPTPAVSAAQAQGGVIVGDRRRGDSRGFVGKPERAIVRNMISAQAAASGDSGLPVKRERGLPVRRSTTCDQRAGGSER